jgi:hypothetical protein
MATDGSGASEVFAADDIVGDSCPGGDTPIEANIRVLSSAARSLRKCHTWVRGAQPRSEIHLKRSRLQVVM